ncbi:TIGR03986 family CRISPR-associated RAMP protein [Chroococcus sp. FPU101]|uniref:TIGR03986 family type III CRISPR-associated RAMP protein n=1 Tax=Chroococcus sp. FPU101 TaxID=1974212 RepID=UPI001A8E1FCA|nr:TIGR03986 family CRISPR-associated RAMP protein [Chroococcus sp. FPU101]GFE68270.1 CRISPR-associated RAMP family protein [Chroococcus sp. FPU101]
MNPKHIKNVPNDRKAVAPYNFVELPEKVVEAQLPLPSGDCYHSDRNTGRIECTLTTESPLYTRCGMTPDEFKAGKESKDLPNFFYTDKFDKPAISGSSLRGMLRTLVEIVSFSKIDKDKVSDEHKFFFRAVAADRDDPLKNEYSYHLGRQGNNVKAGYLQQQGSNWFIRPASNIDGQSFFWIKETIAQVAIPELIPMKNYETYHPQYFVNISFEDVYTNNGRDFVNNISKNSQDYQHIGVLVTAGNMLEGATEQTNCLRKNHYVINLPDANANLIPIAPEAIKDYCNALTPFQKQEPPFSTDKGVLRNGRAIFYCPPKLGDSIKLFGQSPNFRIPYLPKGKTRASSAVDFIPDYLKDINVIDLADSIFGWVRREPNKVVKEVEVRQHSGRVFITDALFQKAESNLWYTGNIKDTVIPQILSSPKPTTFQHYLVQPQETEAKKENLKHYASKPVEKTVIRGHKLYWHKGNEPDFKHPEPQKASTSQITEIKPISQGVTFKFTIYFENLTDVELGALLWVLNHAKGKHRLKLGMGKPLGMGTVKIESELYLTDCKHRYNHLFSNTQWAIGRTKSSSQDFSKYISNFEDYLKNELQLRENFSVIPRIQQLLAMLSWNTNPAQDYLNERRYMEIERQQQPYLGNDFNEYKARLVLPTPLQIRLQDNPSLFSENQIVKAKVVDLKEEQIQKGKKNQLRTIISYEISGSDCLSLEEINKEKVFLNVGDVVRVNIVKVQGISIRKVKRIES